MRRRFCALIGLALLSGPATAQTSSGFYTGYVQTAGAPYTQMQATWRIPWVTQWIPESGSPLEALSSWIGIGCLNGPLWQLVILSEITSPSGASGYFAELETYPNGPGAIITDSGHPTVPGDLITGTLQCTAACTNGNTGQTWSATLVDYTQGWTYNNTFGPFGSNAVNLNSACTISENVNMGAQGYVLGNYGTVTYTGITVNNANPALSFSQSYQQTGNFYGQISGASHPGPNGDSFTTCWQVAAASCPTPTAAQPVNYGSGVFH